MINEIKDLSWAEAERWLAKHGFGLTQIEQQRIIWEEANFKPIEPSTPVVKPKAIAPKASKPAVNDQITDAITSVDK